MEPQHYYTALAYAYLRARYTELADASECSSPSLAAVEAHEVTCAMAGGGCT